MRLRSLFTFILSICPTVTSTHTPSNTPIVIDAALKTPRFDADPTYTYTVRVGQPSSFWDLRPNIYDLGLTVFSNGSVIPTGEKLNSHHTNLESYFGSRVSTGGLHASQNSSFPRGPFYFQDRVKAEHAGVWVAQNVPIRMLISNDTMPGSIGLGVRFPFLQHDDSDAGGLSLLENLRRSSQIPSLSWTYSEGIWVMKQDITSGAYFMWAHMPANLVMGGYDKEKCDYGGADTQKYPLKMGSVQTFDHFRLPRMNLSLSSKTSNSINVNYLTTDVFIDNTATFTYLPQTICDQIALQLDLQWEPEPKLYLVSNKTLDIWFQSNATFNFEFREGDFNPYIQAIDMLIHTKRPYLTTKTEHEWILPIRPIPEDGRPMYNYTAILGRSFLKTACMTADYENKQFAIIPLDQSRSYKEYRNIVPIEPPADAPKAHLAKSKTPNVLKIFLIVLTSVLGATVVVSMSYICIKRKRKNPDDEKSKSDAKELSGVTFSELDSGSSMWEMDTLKSPIEMISPVCPIELEGSPIAELGGREVVVKR